MPRSPATSSSRFAHHRRLRPPRGVTIALTILVALAAGSVSFAAASTDSPSPRGVTGWITTADGARRLSPIGPVVLTRSTTGSTTTIAIDPSKTYQTVDGYGGALTESSAWLLSRLPTAKRRTTLRALFDPQRGAGLSYVRVPIGASDFALSAYSYDDVPRGQTDPSLARFSIAHDEKMLIPTLREIVQINPNVKFLASTWSPPAWMKDSGTMYGGSLQRQYFGVYAQYLVKAVQAYAAHGITFDTLTVQNEPRYSGVDYPTMTLTADDEATLIGSYVGPLFKDSHIDTKILAYDHNWDNTTYATSVLSNASAARYIAGTAWHCYDGDVGAQTTVHTQFPSKSTYFTECSGRSWAPDFGPNLDWNVQRILGAIHNFARTALLWNLAVDPNRGPHTGGCTDCRGIITIDPSTDAVTKNPEYDVLALAAKAARPGAVRVESPWDPAGLATLAFANPDGSHGIVVYNNATSDRRATITGAGATFTVTVPARSLASYRF